MRAFASGCTALTGVEAISNGVPAFKPPKSENAARTLAAMGLIAVVLFGGTTALAANTAFNGFPMLASILAQHRHLPRQLHTLGDRLAYSNGIILLAAIAGALIYAYHGSVTRLIQLYILGVFTSFTVSQIGMVRHWGRALAVERDPVERRQIRRSQLINGAGATLTALVLVIVLATKFTHGAYLVVIAIPLLYWLMRAIRRHYDHVRAELEPEQHGQVLPPRVHAMVLVSQLHKPTLQALAYARATHPDSLTAVTVATSPDEVRTLQEQWAERAVPVPLTVLESPYRDLVAPVLDHVALLRQRGPRDLVVVYIPEYVVGRWWEHLLHNQSALRLKARLLFQRGVMVVSVPWQLKSSRPDEWQTPLPRSPDLDEMDKALR